LNNPDSKPDVFQQGQIFELIWPEGIKANVSRIRTHSDGRTTGELMVRVDKTKFPSYGGILLQSLFNLSTIRSRNEMAKELATQCPQLDRDEWGRKISQLCGIILQKLREGEPVEELWSHTDVPPPEYLLYPILPKNLPTVLFGEAEAGKSYLALYLAICVQLPWPDNPFHFRVGDTPTRTLYLDWETSSEDINYRLKCLSNGLGIPNLSINYRRCTLPLASDVEQIGQHILHTKAGLIIIDSIGKATGGDLNQTEAVFSFLNSLRQTNTSALLIGHTSKEDLKSKRRSPFGSIFFTNDPRCIWEQRKTQDVNENTLSIGLFSRKFNIGSRPRPIGLEFVFDGDSLQVLPQDIASVPELAEHLSATSRVKAYLKSGSASVSQIQEELGLEKSAIAIALNRLQKKGQVAKLGGGVWDLLPPNP